MRGKETSSLAVLTQASGSVGFFFRSGTVLLNPIFFTSRPRALREEDAHPLARKPATIPSSGGLFRSKWNLPLVSSFWPFG